MYHVLVLKKDVHKPGYFQYTIHYEGKSFSCPRTQKGLTSYYMHFSSFKICNFKTFLVSAILHYISLLRLLPKSYFKICTFQPNFLCSGSFKQYTSLIVNYLFLVNPFDPAITENTPERVHECLFRMFFQLCIWFVGSIPGTWNTERNNVIIIMCVKCFQSNIKKYALKCRLFCKIIVNK